jgi:hypothetical protein
MNHSGKKESVIICCLTTEVVKVVEPVKFYGATRVHIISYPNSGVPESEIRFYNSFLTEARKRIEQDPNVKIMVDYANVLDYHDMAREIINIVAAEKEQNDAVSIYLNISSGTPEYIAAAMLVSMQDPELIAFSVRSRARSMDYDEALSAYSVDGKPVGWTSEVNEPMMVTTFGSEMPDDRLVACLEILRTQGSDSQFMNFNEIIEKMKDVGIWDYVPENNRTRTDDAQKERMFLKRNYITPMLDKGWIAENSRKRNKFILTEKGEAIVSVYGKEYA